MPTTPTSDTPHLWEPNHPYYANWGNYFSNECHIEYNSWAEFVADEGDSDLDMNLVYRWDWKQASEEEERETDELLLFFMGQRKALARSVRIKGMQAADEPAVRAWLTTRWEHLQKLWAPLSAKGTVKR